MGELRRALGLREAVAIGIGGTVGGGVYVLVGTAAGKAGPSALAGFVLAFAAALLIALPYAELACRYPLAGGGYAFARTVLGPRWGFLMGWGYCGAYVFVSGYVTLGFGGYLHAATGAPRVPGALGLVAACLGLNLLGVRVSGRAQAAVVGAAVAGLLAFGLWGLPSVHAARFHPFLPHRAGGLMVAALLAFLAFGGFDMVAAAGEEVSQPERNLPRAILLTLAAVLALYLLVAFVAIGVLGASALGDSRAPLADAASAFDGEPARRMVELTALLTTAATANAVMVVVSRIAFAMGRDRLLPRSLGAVSERTAAPWIALIASALALAAVAGTASISFAAATGGFLYVLHFVPPLVVLTMLRRRGGAEPAFKVPLVRLVLPLALAACVLLLVASGSDGAVGGVAWLAAGATGWAVASVAPSLQPKPHSD